MVNNINNYGVNNTGYNPVSTSQRTNNLPVSNDAVGNTPRPNDSYAFNMTNMPAGRVPAQVGMMDKMNVYFKDVMNTPQNVGLYKAFQNEIKANPQGYLQPDTSDVGKVKDLQKKLSYVGMNMTINGQFGNATEQAVIRFKRSVGINDGFMDKNGNMAVTSVVTPQTWNILNAQVANKMNPNANISTGSYVTPVTPQELNWAKSLMSKVSQFGYKPSASERERYENIYQRQQMGVSNNNGSYSPYTNAAPTEQEVNWAKQMAVKIQQYGYKPNAQEVTKYQDIFKRVQAAKNQPPVQSQSQPDPNNGVSPQELAWAKSLMNRIKGGYSPNAQESAKYQEIFNKTNGNQQVQNTQNNNAPVSQEDLAWAQQMETKVTQGYNPTQQEMSKYENIYKRSQGQTVNTTNTTQPVPQNNGVSAQDLAWAQDFENKVNTQGYKPSQQEMTKYTDIYNKTQQGAQTTQTGASPTADAKPPTQREVDWALELERKTKEENYQPNQNELAIYNDIATKLKAAEQANQQKGKGVGSASADELAWAAQMYTKMQGGYSPTPQESGMLNRIQQKETGGTPQTQSRPPVQNNDPAQDNSTDDTQTTNDSPPVKNNPVGNFNAVAEFAYNATTIKAFKDAFPGVTFKGNSVPYLPDSVAKKVATQYGFTSVSQLQSAVGANVDGHFGPETFFRLSVASSGQVNSPTSTIPASKTANVANTSAPKQGVTQAELDWAVGLQGKFSDGYKPSTQEQAKYTDIFNRYQSSGQTIVDNASTTTIDNTDAVDNTTQTTATGGTGAPTQTEIDWAVALQSKLSSGYKPNAQEQSQYTDIYNRYNANGNKVAPEGQQQTTQPQPTFNGTQTTNYTTSLDPSTPTVGVDVTKGDQDLQWALALLNRVQQQAYVPTDDEVARYEKIIAQNQSVVTTQ